MKKELKVWAGMKKNPSMSTNAESLTVVNFITHIQLSIIIAKSLMMVFSQ